MVGHELKRQEGRSNFNLIKLHVWDLVGTRLENEGKLKKRKSRVLLDVSRLPSIKMKFKGPASASALS